MKSDNRWIYVAGVAVLAIIAIGGYFLSRGDDDESAGEPAGDAGAEASAVDGAPEADGGATGGDLLGTMESVDAAPIPGGGEACRAYCQRLAEGGQLAEGTTLESCVSQLCSEAEEEAEAEGGPRQVISEPALPEPSDDCREQCRGFERRGELRAGTTVEDCFAAMCGSDEAEATE